MAVRDNLIKYVFSGGGILNFVQNTSGICNETYSFDVSKYSTINIDNIRLNGSDDRIKRITFQVDIDDAESVIYQQENKKGIMEYNNVIIDVSEYDTVYMILYNSSSNLKDGIQFTNLTFN